MYCAGSFYVSGVAQNFTVNMKLRALLKFGLVNYNYIIDWSYLFLMGNLNVLINITLCSFI